MSGRSMRSASTETSGVYLRPNVTVSTEDFEQRAAHGDRLNFRVEASGWGHELPLIRPINIPLTSRAARYGLYLSAYC